MPIVHPLKSGHHALFRNHPESIPAILALRVRKINGVIAPRATECLHWLAADLMSESGFRCRQAIPSRYEYRRIPVDRSLIGPGSAHLPPRSLLPRSWLSTFPSITKPLIATIALSV